MSGSRQQLEVLLQEVRAARDEDLVGDASRKLRGLARARNLVAALQAIGEGRMREGMAHLAVALGEKWTELPASEAAAAAKKKAKKAAKKTTTEKAAKKKTTKKATTKKAAKKATTKKAAKKATTKKAAKKKTTKKVAKKAAKKARKAR